MPEKKIEFIKKQLHSKEHKNEKFKTIRVLRKDKKELKEADIKKYLETYIS